MTHKEIMTLDRMNDKLDNHIKDFNAYRKEDLEWKKTFDIWKKGFVEPLIQKEADRKAVDDWLTGKYKWVVGALGLAATITLILRYTGKI